LFLQRASRTPHGRARGRLFRGPYAPYSTLASAGLYQLAVAAALVLERFPCAVLTESRLPGRSAQRLESSRSFVHSGWSLAKRFLVAIENQEVATSSKGKSNTWPLRLLRMLGLCLCLCPLPSPTATPASPSPSPSKQTSAFCLLRPVPIAHYLDRLRSSWTGQSLPSALCTLQLRSVLVFACSPPEFSRSFCRGPYGCRRKAQSSSLELSSSLERPLLLHACFVNRGAGAALAIHPTQTIQGNGHSHCRKKVSSARTEFGRSSTPPQANRPRRHTGRSCLSALPLPSIG
jgi:hypothetical protein